ncbi:MAG: response regulator [Myxococcales bacterium]|nr:response regulator [Myxococcales bacterium]
MTRELVEALVRLARADFSVRLARNYRRDTEDTLAMFVNLIAEELDRLLKERERQQKELEDGVTALSELFFRLAAGDFSVRSQRTGKGDPLDVLGYLLDNTAAEVGDAFLEIDRQRTVLEAILESMIDGVLVLDAGGVVKRANSAMACLLGTSADTLRGRPLGAVLAPEERAFAAKLASKVARQPLRGRDTQFLLASGGSIPLTLNASPQLGATGELAGVVLVARDDRALRQAQARLQLTDRLATMGTLAAGVAHEINNPLAFLVGNLDFIAEELEDMGGGALAAERLAEVKKALASSQSGAERVRQIVRDLKSFSRVDETSVARLDVQKLLETATGMMRNEIRHRAKLVKAYGAAPPVAANEARLVQVFLNLLQNAAHAIPTGNAEGNEIRIVTGTDPSGTAFVEVHDTGTGIPAEALPRIFDAFFTTKPVGSGTGLGLSISHKIVAAMGGRIEVATRAGVGSAFRVTLPAAGPDVAVAAPAERPSAARGAVRKRVLVVDDEPEVGETIERILGREHEVTTVGSGAAALALLAVRDFELVLCDVMMPEMTGVELCERLREVRPEVAARVVLMSGGSFGETREGVERAPNRRLEKPFDRDLLRAVVAGDW